MKTVEIHWRSGVIEGVKVKDFDCEEAYIRLILPDDSRRLIPFARVVEIRYPDPDA